jgi:hypothetical protein
LKIGKVYVTLWPLTDVTYTTTLVKCIVHPKSKHLFEAYDHRAYKPHLQRWLFLNIMIIRILARLYDIIDELIVLHASLPFILADETIG